MKAPSLFTGFCKAQGHNNLKRFCFNALLVPSKSNRISQQSLVYIVQFGVPDVWSFLHQDRSNGDSFVVIRGKIYLIFYISGSQSGGQDQGATSEPMKCQKLQIPEWLLPPGSKSKSLSTDA